MPATLQTVQALTKEVYGPTVVDTLDDEAVLSKRIEKTSRGVVSEVGGKYVTFPLRVRRNQGIGYRNENERLQNAGQQGYVSVRVPLRYGYGRVHLTGQTMDLVDANYAAFADAMEREMTGLKDDIAKDTNRIMYGNGIGSLATIPANANSVDHTVNTTQYLELGMQVDVVDPTAGTIRASNRQIIDINPTTLLITFDVAVNTAAVNQIIVRNGNWSREPQGLTSIVSDSATELFSLSGASEPRWKSVVDTNAGTPRALSEGLMILMCDKIRRNAGGKPTAIFTDLDSRRAYFNLLSQQRRYNDPKKYDGGLVGLAFNYGTEIPVVEENDAPLGKMWFVNEKNFTIYRDKPWSWLDRDGAIWKWVDDYDAYQAVMKQYWEFGCDSRHGFGLLGDIQAG